MIGNGLFKPNISSIVGQLHKDGDIRKDGGYTIFYMGLMQCLSRILLCGYIGEKVGWHLGFGRWSLYVFGMLQFWFAQKYLVTWLIPKKLEAADTSQEEVQEAVTKKVENDRISVVIIFSLFTIFFWWAFEQAGGSMTIFANDYTERNLVGTISNI